MALPVSERDFDLFTPARQPEVRGRGAARRSAAAATNTAAKPARRRGTAEPAPRPRVVPVVAEPEEPFALKKERARTAWKKTLIAYGASAVVAICLFGGVQTEVSHLQAVSERQALYRELDQLRQESISHQAAVEQKYSLDVIQEYALKKLHMTPVEGGRIWYISHTDGDKVLK